VITFFHLFSIGILLIRPSNLSGTPHTRHAERNIQLFPCLQLGITFTAGETPKYTQRKFALYFAQVQHHISASAAGMSIQVILLARAND
jgi:hypothetical protein